MRISDWSSDVCSSDLERPEQLPEPPVDVAQAIVIIVDEAVPAFLVVVAHDAVEEIVESHDRAMRLGLGRKVVLVEARRQVELVVDLVERNAGPAAERSQYVRIGTAFGPLSPRVINHDVVRIKQAAHLEPGIAAPLVP